MGKIPARMKAVLLKDGGYAASSLPASQVREVAAFLEQGEADVPKPRSGQVLIKVIGSMVNPSDLAFIQGGYGQPRVKGDPAGFEGIGRVVAGKGFMAKRLIGKRVSFVMGAKSSGAWAEYVAVDAATAIKLKDGVRDEDGAALVVNPLTAAAMVNMVPEKGAFIASGAASQLGKLMAGLAEETGRRMIGTVRRDEPIQGLKDLGAKHVLNETSESFWKDLAGVIAEEKPTYFLDCVAGSVSARVFDAMGNDSHWVVYGKLTTEPPEIIEPGKLIFQRKVIEGFWLVTWMRRTGILGKLKAIGQVQDRFASGRWKTDISAKVPLGQVVSDLPKALNKADGKVMITME